MKRLAALILLTAFLLHAQAPPPEKPLPSCFPADTMLVARFDVAQMLDQRVFQDFMTAKLGGMDAFFLQFQTWTGIDLGTIKTGWLGLVKEDHVVIVLKGAFDVQTVQSTVLNIDTAQVVRRPGVPFAVMLPENKKPGDFNMAALLDKETLVFGRPDLVDGFLAALKGKGKGLPPPAVALTIPMLKSESLVSAALISLPEAELRKNPLMRLFTHGQITADLSEEDLELTLEVGLKKPEMREPATKAIEGIRDLYGMLDDDLRQIPRLAEIALEGISVRPDKKRLLLDLTLSREVVEGLLREKLGLQ